MRSTFDTSNYFVCINFFPILKCYCDDKKKKRFASKCSPLKLISNLTNCYLFSFFLVSNLNIEVYFVLLQILMWISVPLSLKCKYQLISTFVNSNWKYFSFFFVFSWIKWNLFHMVLIRRFIISYRKQWKEYIYTYEDWHS